MTTAPRVPPSKREGTASARRSDAQPQLPKETSARRGKPSAESATVQNNVEAIASWEQEALHTRSQAERVSEWITATASSGLVLAAHVVWFALWILANLGLIPGVVPFDPFPFPFLTFTVSLEAIFMTLFVLSSQNRLARHADKRAHLDLQVNLLAEREMTAVLQLLHDIAERLDVTPSVSKAQLRDLAKETDIHELTEKVDEMEEQDEKEPATTGRRRVRLQADR